MSTRPSNSKLIEMIVIAQSKAHLFEKENQMALLKASVNLLSTIDSSLKTMFTSHQPIRLEALRAQYAGCTQCPLGTQGRTQVVFGTGPENASIMLVGEAPGHDEDLKGIPFIGRSGKLLRQILSECRLSPEEIYITNSAKCRPPENRTPTPYERTTCSHLILLKEIHCIRPQVICTIGATATATFLDATLPFSSLRGKIIQTEYFAIMPTYHPAYLLRNRSAVEIVKNDFLALKAFLMRKL